MRTPILMAWSGGKDSALALRALRADPSTAVVGLLTAVTAGYERISIHGIRRAILAAQADALGLPVFAAELQPASSNAQYEAAWGAALDEARASVGAVAHVAYGDLFLEDVKQYRDDLGRRLGFTGVYPLWGRDTAALAREFVDAGYEAYLTCVDTTQLAAEFTGRRFDHDLLRDLPPSVDPCGERGEFHTCVVAGPGFDRRLVVRHGDRVRRDGRFEYQDLLLEAPT